MLIIKVTDVTDGGGCGDNIIKMTEMVVVMMIVTFL